MALSKLRAGTIMFNLWKCRTHCQRTIKCISFVEGWRWAAFLIPQAAEGTRKGCPSTGPRFCYPAVLSPKLISPALFPLERRPKCGVNPALPLGRKNTRAFILRAGISSQLLLFSCLWSGTCRRIWNACGAALSDAPTTRSSYPLSLSGLRPLLPPSSALCPSR